MVAAFLITAAVSMPSAPDAVLASQSISVDAPEELAATITAECYECEWDVVGREAITLRITLDDRYSQHVPLLRTGRADYSIALGRVDAGTHTVRVDVDTATTASELRGEGIASATVALKTLRGSPALAYAPFLYARANTVGRFTDVPMLMWYESSPTPRGTRYQYSVIFTNEDGGTQTDRLMATWGRTTDIEYVYSVEVDRSGLVVAEDYQGPDHQVRPFRGRREGQHPLLWVATDNNMVTDRGDTTIRYAPLAAYFDLSRVSREAVMDANPWSYAVAAKEMMREGKIATNPQPGANRIPDPRRFVYLEACADVGTAAVAFAVRIDESWISSDLGLATHRIVRDGCFRAAVPLPEGVDQRNVTAIRIAAYERPARSGQAAPPAAPVRLTRINKAFGLNSQYLPLPLHVEWRGIEDIPAGGHFDLPVSKPRPQ